MTENQSVEVITRYGKKFGVIEEVSVDGGKTWWTKEQFAQLNQLLIKERLDEVREFAGYEDDDWDGIAQIPQQRFIERIKHLQSQLKEMEK